MSLEGPAARSYSVGDIEIITVTDGQRSFPLSDDFILNAGRDEINQALEAAGMPPDQMTIVFNPIVIRTGSKQILLDTGNGAGAGGLSPSGPGLLAASLSAAGITPESIDLVIISHFHADHINGLLMPDQTCAFANAEITVPEREWSFWTDDNEWARAPAGRMQELFANVGRVFASLTGRVRHHAWGKEVAEGIVAMGTPGHTIGHTSYVVTSGQDSLFVQSDVTNHPALFACHPGWHARFDQNPAEAETTRRRIYDMLVAEALPVQGFHFPFPSRGRVEKTRNGYRIEPLDEER